MIEAQINVNYLSNFFPSFLIVMSGLWVRNGLQMKGQAMTYIQCHFCNSMADADLYLLQVAMMNLHHGDFLNSVFER